MKKVNYVKDRPLNKITTLEDIPVKDLNSHELEKCRKILEQGGEAYTNEEIKIIYDYLYEMADISITEYLKTNYYEESNYNVKG